MSTPQAKPSSDSDLGTQTASTRGDSTMQPTRDIVNYVREYAREKPDVAALWCFGVGIVVGWKIKPW